MATFLRTQGPSISTATRATARHLQSRKRLRLRPDERPTVPCPVTTEDLVDAGFTIPAPPPSCFETLRPDAVPKRNGTVRPDADLEPRAMFVLGLIDGFTPIDDVIAASGLAEKDAQKMLVDLVARGLVLVA